MINAKIANALTEEMFCIGGIRGKIYRQIVYAIAAGESHIKIDYAESEVLDCVLNELVDIGYKVTRTKKYKITKDNYIVSEYIYCISW